MRYGYLQREGLVTVISPCDWDGESYCVEGCGEPATHRRIYGWSDDAPVMELVCCIHAIVEEKTMAKTAAGEGDEGVAKALMLALPFGILFWIYVIRRVARNVR